MKEQKEPINRQPEIYQGVEVSECAQRRFQIHYGERDGEGLVEVADYTSVNNLFYSYGGHDGQEIVSLLFLRGAVFLKGLNLRSVADDFQEERVRSFTLFDPTRHKTPEPGAAVIHNIEWRTTQELRDLYRLYSAFQNYI